MGEAGREARLFSFLPTGSMKLRHVRRRGAPMTLHRRWPGCSAQPAFRAGGITQLPSMIEGSSSRGQ